MHNLKKLAVFAAAGLLCTSTSLTPVRAVDDSDYPYSTGITLNHETIEIATSQSVQLNASTAEGQPAGDVSWISSDENVATVDDNGKVNVIRYGKAVITAVSDEDPSLTASCRILSRFSDVNDSGKYYYKPVYWAADNGITTGYDKVYFGPQRDCTRRELSIFLWRLAGKPEASGNLPFSDTKNYSTSTDTYKAILWCYTNGIVKGYSDGSFKPNASIVRKDTMIMLYRLAGKPSVSGSMKFPDVRALNYPSSSDTYRSIIWGTQNGITNGYQNGSFQPLTNCLREHIVTFIYRYDKIMNPEAELANDTDQDGLSNFDEEAIGTNPENPDTDGDGYTDYAEFILGTDPLAPEEIDPSLDTDEDGITDAVEAKIFETDPYSEDTDNDGLTDYDEIYVYHTDPLTADTDEDGLSDDFELENELAPLNPEDGKVPVEQTLGEVGISILLQEDTNYAVPSISGTAVGELADHIFIATSDDSAVQENRSLVGMPVYVDAEDDYVNGLTLSFDLSSYEGSRDALCIGKLEEDGTYVPVESFVDGDTISCVLEESGSYFVIDVDEFLHAFGIDFSELGTDTFEPVPEAAYAAAGNEIPVELLTSSSNMLYNAAVEDELTAAEDTAVELDGNGKTGSETIVVPNAYMPVYNENKVAELAETLASGAADVSGQADIVFAIDTTGSMSGAISNVISNVAAFATALADDYNVQINYSIVDFKDIEEDGEGTTKILKNGSSNWYSSTDQFISAVRSLSVNGGGDLPESDIDALEMARRLDWRPSANKFIILITDADYKIANSYGIGSLDEEISLLRDSGINVSVITDSSYQSRYQNLYETTGGIYANIYGDFSSALMSLAGMIGEATSDGTWVILKHGYRYVKLLDDSNGDQDDDGISDAEELGTKETVDLSLWVAAKLYFAGIPSSEYYGKKTIEVYNAKSDPTRSDTDGDGIKDTRDTAPWTNGLRNGVVGAIKICSYGDGSSSFAGIGGHAFIAYTSYVSDTLKLYGIEVTSKADTAKENDSRSDRPAYHYVSTPSHSVISIGGWAGWLPDELKGTWINNEYYIFIDGVNSDQRSLTEYITQSQKEKMQTCTKDNSKWTYLYNCSAYAADMWNTVLDDDLSPYAPWASPRSLSHSIEQRSGYRIAEPLLSSWPGGSSGSFSTGGSSR